MAIAVKAMYEYGGFPVTYELLPGRGIARYSYKISEYLKVRYVVYRLDKDVNVKNTA